MTVNRKKELDYMNALASLLVILIHVLSIGITGTAPDSWQAAVLYFPWRLSAFVVPMFLYTGAQKVALAYKDRALTVKDYGTYLLRRVKSVYLPYVLWVVIYYLFFLSIGYVRGEASEFFTYLHVGNLSAPFYYIIIVMQFYFLLPLWTWLIKRVPAYAGISLALLITLLGQQSGNLFVHFGLNFPYTDRILPTYLVFWVIGLYVGRDYDRIKASLSQIGGIVTCLAGALLFCGISYYQHRTGQYLLSLTDSKLLSDLCSIFALHGLCTYLSKAPMLIRRVLDKIYGWSLPVYLSHCLFLTAGTIFLENRGIKDLTVLLSARLIICYTTPFGLCFLWELCKKLFAKLFAKKAT